MTTNTPEPWAIDEARRRAGAPPAPYNDGSLTALAHMIQVYEKPPTPPNVLRARSLVAGVLRMMGNSPNLAHRTEAGEFDQAPALQAVLAALRDPRAPSPTAAPNTAVQAAFEAGFYAGAREERKDGTPYAFRNWKTCFNEWSAS